MSISNNTKNKGYTIVESLVAIAILVLIVVGVSSVAQTSISSYIISKDEVIAFYLAQEAIEQVRNIRDQNRITGASWLSNINPPCTYGYACRVDPFVSPPLAYCGSPGTCTFLYQETSTGRFGHTTVSGWVPTIFKREVVLTSVNANEISIKATVSWSKGSVSRTFTAREDLLNW